MSFLRSILPILGLACAGCAGDFGLTSELGGAEGVVYHLPKSILEITVREYRSIADDRVWYSIGGPSPLADASSKHAEVPSSNRIGEQIVPDLRHRYVVKYHPSKLSDDRLCISRKPNGLLHDVQFVADDRTPQVVFNIAQFVGGFGGSKVYFDQKESDAKAVTMRSYTGKVDPFDPEGRDVDAYNRALSRIFDADLKLNFRKLHEIVRSTAKLPAHCNSRTGCPVAEWGPRCSGDRICYRSKLMLPVALDLNGNSVDMKYASVINPWDIGEISVTRAFLVKKVTKLRFDQGTLLAAVIRKPSEVEEASLLPLNVMNAILSVPSGLWQSAFADPETKNAAITALTEHNEQVKKLAAVDRRKLLLEGSAATDSENYDLNCQVTSGSKMFNWLSSADEMAN